MWILGLILFFFLSGQLMFVSLGLASVIVLLTVFNMPVHMLSQLIITRVSSYPLLAMPLFMLAGNLLLAGGGAKKMVEFFDSLLGHIPGGMLLTVVGFCTFFAAMTGSGYATIAAIGTMMLPQMKEAGYSARLRTGIIVCAGQLGNCIPPSITLVSVGVLTERSVATLFAGSLIPGLCISAGLLIVGYIVAKVQGVATKPKATWKTRWSILVKAIPALVMPIFILGGIYTGQFTPTEAAAISCLYAIIIGIFVYGGLRSWTSLKTGFFNAMRSAVMIYMIFVAVATFATVISRSGFAVWLSEQLLAFGLGRLGVVIVWNCFMLVLGFFYNPISLMYLTIPILGPVFESLGVNLIWLGVLWLLNALIGAVTPPMAGALYVTARVADEPPETVFRGALPFLGVWVCILFLCMFIPGLITWLPERMGFLVF